MTESAKNIKHPMEALLNNDNAVVSPPRPGEMVTGVVISAQNNRILIEINGAYTGMIGGREAIDGLGTAKQLAVGDEVSAYVVEDERGDGMYILSLRKVGRERAWDKLNKLIQSGEVVEVRIKEANKGGLMTELYGVRAFIPVSHLAPEHYPRVNGAQSAEILRRLQSYVGENFAVKVLTAERDDEKLILSEKEAISGKREVALKKLKVGQKVKGKVSGIVNFGLFLLFEDCLEGLVHVSEIAWGHVSDPAAHARLGEEKEALVIGVDNDKISLSMKRLLPDPWLDLVAEYKEGDVVTGEVNKITPFGAFVTIKKDLNGLIHISEIAQDEGAEKAEVKLEVGQKVEAKIINIDTDEHRLGLSLKALEGDDAKPAKKKTTKKAEAEEAVEEEA
jgi:ribosomal protein S1